MRGADERGQATKDIDGGPVGSTIREATRVTDPGTGCEPAAQVSQVRMQRILQLREAIAAGTYTVSAAALVEKMPAGLRVRLFA